jgi:hypothetical protein
VKVMACRAEARSAKAGATAAGATGAGGGTLYLDREIEYSFDTDQPILGRPPAGDRE